MTKQKQSSDTDTDTHTDAQRTSRRGVGVTTVITLTLVVGVVLAASISPLGVVAAATEFSVTTTAPETVTPDETIDITYTIENTGDTDLESLALSGTPQTSDTELTITDAASDSAATITEDNRIIFETVAPGASVTATLTVAVGTDATGTESLTAETTNGFGESEVSKQTVTELTVTTETETPTATVQFDDQTVQNGSTIVDIASATFNGSENFNIVVHQATDDNGDGVIQTSEVGAKIGESFALAPGTHTDIVVNLTQQLAFTDDVSQLTENQTLVAMLHTTDTDDSDNDNIVHAAPITRDGTPVFDQAEITVQQQQQQQGTVTVETDTLPSIIETGGSLGQQSATFSNPGNQNIQTVSLVINGETRETQSVNIPAGTSQTVTFEAGEINVDPGADVTAELRVDGTTVVQRSLDVTDQADTGAITGDVRTLAGGPVQNVQELNINIIRVEDDREMTGAPTNSPVQPDANGEYTVEVPVAGDQTEYRVEVSSPRLEQAFSQQITVFPGETETLDIRLIPKDTGVTQEQELRLDVTVANDDGTQVKSALVPPGDQRNVQVRVTARPIDAASGTPFEPFAGKDVTLELTDRTAGELGVGGSITPEVTVTTNDNGIATTTFRSAVTRSQNTNVTASTRNGDGELFETDSSRGQNLNDNGEQAEIKTAGTLTGDIRDGDGELIRNRPVNVLLEKNGRPVQNRTIDQGQYNFDNLETGDQYRVTATFPGESGSATIESLSPGTNTRDIVIADITLGGITSSDVTLSDSTPSPGSNVTVTVTATPENGNVGFSFNHLFNQSVATASAPTAQIGGVSVDPSISAADQNRATVTLGADDVTAGEQITIEYTITTAETAGQTVSLTGSVTNGDTQEQELPEISYTTTDPEDTGAIVGDIVRVDGSEIENVEQLEIQLFRDGVEVTGDPTNSPVQADANGEYTAFVPVNGDQTEYRVEVSSPRFVEFAREVTIQPQATERVDIRLQESSTSTSAIDATRSLTSTEVTNGSTVTVTVSATFERSIDDATLVDNINGQGISADNLTITDADGGFSAVTENPAVDVTYNDQIGFGLGSDSFTVEYEITIPEDTPLGTTITFDGDVTNSATSETAGIDGDSSVEVVATTGPDTDTDTVTVGGQEVPTEFTSETNNGDRTVTADNAVEAINTFIAGDVSADVAVDVINAFIAS